MTDDHSRHRQRGACGIEWTASDDATARREIMRTIDAIASNVRANAAPDMVQEIAVVTRFVYRQLAAQPDSYFAAMLTTAVPEGVDSPAHAVWVYMCARAVIDHHALRAADFEHITEDAFQMAARIAKLRRLS